MFWTGILTRIARNVLHTFNHWMNLLISRHARKLFNLFFGQVTTFQKMHCSVNAFFRLFYQLATITRGKHTLPERFQGCFVGSNLFLFFGLFQESQRSCNGDTGNSALNHRRTCFFNAGNIACCKNPRNRSFSICIANRNLSATLWIIFHLAACHFQQLRHRRKSDCQTNCIYLKMLFCARNKLEMGIHFRNGNTGYMVCSLCLLNGMGKIERHATPGNLCCMNAIAANSWGCIHQRNHFTTCLQQLIADNQTNITRTNHQNFLPRLYALNVHHGLGCTCSDDTRNVPALERNHVFCCTRCNDDGIALIVMDFAVFLHGDFFIFIDAHDGCI